MHLVCDVLDNRVVDRNGRDIGRVDGIELELRDDGPPRVAFLQVGPAVLARRLSPFLGRLVSAFEQTFDLGPGRPVRIAYEQVLDVRDHVRVDVAVGETGALEVERRLRRLIGRIPGG